MKYLLVLSLLLFIGCYEKQEVRKIRVSGEGKIRVTPNQVTLTLEVSFTQKRMVDAVQMTQNTVDSVISILAQFGKRGVDIKTSNITANKHYEYIRGKNTHVGFEATQTIDFVLKDIHKFTTLTGQLLETDISSISNLQFGHSKADSILRQVDLLAYENALQTATMLCEKSGVKLGKILFISNGYNTHEQKYFTSPDIASGSRGFVNLGFKISPEVIVFSREISAEYEIE